MINPKWQQIAETLKFIFHIDMLIPGEERHTATIEIDGFTFAILEDLAPKLQDAVKISLRASLQPTDAARLTVAVVSHYFITFGPHFEYDNKGNLLLGDNALEFAWGSPNFPPPIELSTFDEMALGDQYIQPN